MAAVLMQVTRTAVMEVMRADYVVFAEAKGLPRRRILFLHVLKNALAPAVSVAAIEIGALLGGNMIVETIFAWPGVGRLVVEAIFARNYPLVQAAVLLYAAVLVILNFAADLLYAVLNPRVARMKARAVINPLTACASHHPRLSLPRPAASPLVITSNP